MDQRPLICIPLAPRVRFFLAAPDFFVLSKKSRISFPFVSGCGMALFFFRTPGAGEMAGGGGGGGATNGCRFSQSMQMKPCTLSWQ